MIVSPEAKARSRASQRARRDAARAAGLCTTCRKRPAEQGRCRCVECDAHRKDPRSMRRANYLSKRRKAARAAAKRTVEDRQQEAA